MSERSGHDWDTGDTKHAENITIANSVCSVFLSLFTVRGFGTVHIVDKQSLVRQNFPITVLAFLSF